jgi:hypothetical protein
MSSPSQPKNDATLGDQKSSRLAIALSVMALVIFAFAIRAMQAGSQSAYMDEATNIQVGRTLLAGGSPSPDLVGRDYGSYVWPLVSSSVDRLGGLLAVRLVTAGLGAVMVLSTAVFAYRCIPEMAGHRRRWAVALIAGLIMAVFPTAIALGRFGTYDALAGAGFMSAVALVVPVRRRALPPLLLLAAALLFIGFLAKYVLAIYFPIICLYLMFRRRSLRQFLWNTIFFVLPLAAACAAYAYLNRHQLAYLLHFSGSYSDLKSDFPVREYLLERGDLLVLGLLAVWGVRSASRECRVVTLAGAGIIFAFQALARADYDFWKHSIYAVYFLAPLAAIALAPVLEWVIEGAYMGAGLRQGTGTERLLARTAIAGLVLWQGWLMYRGRWNTNSGRFLLLAIIAGLAVVSPPALSIARQHKRSWFAMGLGLVASIAAGAVLTLPLAHAETLAQSLVDFYPNLDPSQDAIRNFANGAQRLLVDDSAVRYYVRDEVPYNRVTDPFFITYRGKEGVDAYRQAIDDRFFDTIVLDGGIGPQGQMIRQQLEGEILGNYDRVYSNTASNGTTVEIFQARTTGAVADVSGSSVTYFDSGSDWGSHPGNGQLQPGQGVTITDEQVWQGHKTLRFSSSDAASEVGFAVNGAVSKFQVDVYLLPTTASGSANPPSATIGMVGFDQNWGWHDDAFHQQVPVGRWEHLTWQLSQPGSYRELGLKLPDSGAWTLYVGRAAVQP